MALRKIVEQGDECLTKVCRPVTKFDRRLHDLLDDMAETLADANGAGLAAPQVGILRRVCLVLDEEACTAYLTRPGMAIDLGGIAKGYASDRLADIFARYGVDSALVSLGGNVYARGTKPGGAAWSVAVQHPEQDGYAAMLSLTDAFAVTSGGYQRYFTGPDGTVYQHILDPKTGWPVQGDLLSVTIVADNGTMADAYSTALYVMGRETAQDFWRQNGGF